MYYNGRGVPQNHSNAVRWFRAAAEQGDDDAQTNLGIMYVSGRGVPQNHAAAVRWYRAAAVQGNARAQNNLAIQYGIGLGVPKNLVNAHMWANLAAAQGNSLAAETREQIAREMSPAQLAQAQRRASACLAANYRNC